MNAHKPDKHIVSASAIIIAAARSAYTRCFPTTTTGTREFFPREFTSLVVERGGVGAGTIIRFDMSVFGRRQSFRAAITEPEPGPVLVETDLDANGAVTTFTVNPGGTPADSQVTISTELPMRGGLLGKIEKTLTTILLRPIYIRELENLARVATGPLEG